MGTLLRRSAENEKAQAIRFRVDPRKAGARAYPSRHRGRLARANRAWNRAVFVTGLLVVMGLGTAGGVLLHHHPRAEAGEDRTIMVYEGDTLWSIASQYAGPDVDVREWIYQLRQLNHLTGEGTLYPGMILHLPASQ
ncbi:LysM peptidoglycan-binding domain-containing protein [Kyrpidia spormannii]|uniref:LysM domain-containing protein n=1 Tax=Kyrpidia spormannii TaxID=2055160 RepID=A0A6F9EA17_9BACL|nr:LysM domain-containing protein [Kyrpidia spormannii]CAB3393142.1 conserved protein of unknown function [Kyrpidia spormannii]